MSTYGYIRIIKTKTEKLIGIVKAARFPFKDPVPNESPIIKVTPIIANTIATYPRDEIFSFKKKYAIIGKKIVWVLIMKTTFATLVSVIEYM